MKAKTKIEIESEILQLTNSARHHKNNETGARFQATEAKSESERRRCLEAAALAAKHRDFDLQQIASRRALVEAHEYHALTVREAPRDRAWAEFLSHGLSPV